MTKETEHKLAEQLFGGGEQKGVVETLKEAALAVAPGLKNLIPDVADELKHQVAHGVHEIAAALFRDNSGFIMYPRREGRDDEPTIGVHGPAAAESQPEQPEQEIHQERGGRSM